MTHVITIEVELSEKLTLISAGIGINSTDLPSNGATLKKVVDALHKVMNLDSDSIGVQDLLHDLNIERSKE